MIILTLTTSLLILLTSTVATNTSSTQPPPIPTTSTGSTTPTDDNTTTTATTSTSTTTLQPSSSSSSSEPPPTPSEIHPDSVDHAPSELASTSTIPPLRSSTAPPSAPPTTPDTTTPSSSGTLPQTTQPTVAIDQVTTTTISSTTDASSSTEDDVVKTTEGVTTTAFEQTIEHNAILTTTFEDVTEKEVRIVVGHKCSRIFQDSILWNDTDGGMLALKSCPTGYQGNMYRPCFSNGKWGNVDYSECRLEHLGRMRHMIGHQVQKGMLGNMYVLVEEFSKYISSVDMKSPMDRLEAFEILNTFLKLDMNLKMDKSKDTKYIQTLLHACNELIKKKTVLFSPGSQENKLITEKAVEMVFDLTYFAEKALRGLLKTQKKQIAFRSSPNVVLYLYRGKLSGQFALMNFTSEQEREDEASSLFNLEKTLERSAYALIWIKGLRSLLSSSSLIVNSDVAVATILSPLNSINHMPHPPTFDIGLRMLKPTPRGFTLECGQMWNMTHLWNTNDCTKASVKGDIVTCRCHHLGSISLLLQEESRGNTLGPVNPIGKMISISCVVSLSAAFLTLVVNFLLQRGEHNLTMFILMNLIVSMMCIQLTFLYGVNNTDRPDLCLSSALFLHFLFVGLCCWVVAFGVNLLWRLRTNMEYLGRPRDFCATCWIAPGLLLAFAFALNPHGYETSMYCWMNIQRGILWSFVFPVTGLILVNTVVMLLALKTFNEQMSVIHRIDICRIKNSLRAGIILLPSFAINWFFGILAVENSTSTVLQAIFSLTNAMQGLLTFIFFCIMDTNVQVAFRLKVAEVSRNKPKVSNAMRLRKSGSFPVLERSLVTLSDDRRRLDCTPLLAGRAPYHADDPCCSNIRV